MEGFIAIGLLMLLMIIGVPVAWSFAGVLAYMVYAYDANLNTLMLQGYRSVDSVILIALPLFVLTGYLMQSGGIARRLVDFIEVMIGKRRGGMGPPWWWPRASLVPSPAPRPRRWPPSAPS